MIELVYLNKNLSKAEADKIVANGQEVREALTDKMMSNAAELTNEQAIRYFNACAPFIVML